MGGRIESSNPFSLLADETRLGVIEAIGDASGDGEYACLSYSTIREVLDDHDSGNLNYHLRKLKDRFVERTDHGYQLTVPGIRVYQAISSGQYEASRTTVSPTEIAHECDDCERPLLVSYEDGRFVVECSDCDIRFSRYPLSPNAFDLDDPESLVVVGETKVHLDLQSMFAGVCPYCSGAVHHEVTSDDGGINAQQRDIYARVACSNCGWYSISRIEMVVYLHPATTVFYEERGHQSPVGEVTVEGEWNVTALAEDPWRIEVEVELNRDVIRHVVDGDLNVVKWEVVTE